MKGVRELRSCVRGERKSRILRYPMVSRRSVRVERTESVGLGCIREEEKACVGLGCRRSDAAHAPRLASEFLWVSVSANSALTRSAGGCRKIAHPALSHGVPPLRTRGEKGEHPVLQLHTSGEKGVRGPRLSPFRCCARSAACIGDVLFIVSANSALTRSAGGCRKIVHPALSHGVPQQRMSAKKG